MPVVQSSCGVSIRTATSQLGCSAIGGAGAGARILSLCKLLRTGKTKHAAWRSKPRRLRDSTDDRTINPDLQRLALTNCPIRYARYMGFDMDLAHRKRESDDERELLRRIARREPFENRSEELLEKERDDHDTQEQRPPVKKVIAKLAMAMAPLEIRRSNRTAAAVFSVQRRPSLLERARSIDDAGRRPVMTRAAPLYRSAEKPEQLQVDACWMIAKVSVDGIGLPLGAPASRAKEVKRLLAHGVAGSGGAAPEG